MSLDSATLAHLRGQDAAHFLHPFTDNKDLAAVGARVITHAEGIYVFDGEGRKILDGMSGLWCVNLGYGRREIADAVHRQMLELPYYNSFFQTTHPRVIELSARLAGLAPAAGDTRFGHVFYSSSGSESNDTNIRLVRRYWDLMGQPQRKTIISRWNGYHGSTIGGASLSGMSGMHSQGDLPIPGVTHIMQPFAFENALPGEDREAFGLRAARALEDRILEIGPDQVAAFIAEPIQGAGGVIIPPDSYWPEIQSIVDRYGILLISDEVICAFGRLGHWFAYEKFGYRPDLVTFAKGVTSGYVPLGGVMVGSRVAQVLLEQGGEFNHGYTYSGHPVACQAALTTLDLMEAEGIVPRVKNDTGPWLAQGFAALGDHPLVGLAESCGLVAGLQLVRDRASLSLFDARQGVGMLCRRHCFDNGVIMRAVGDRMIIAPPLVMTRADVDELLRRIRHALDLTLADVRARGWL